jgi:hypothetical protein
MDRPEWCPDKSCVVTCYMSTKGGGQCVGVLAKPTDHITKGVDTMSRCHYDGVVHSFCVNSEDIIVDTYLNGEALRTLGLTLPKAIVDNLPRG